MPQTPTSSASPYCDRAGLLAWYDWREVAAMLADPDDSRPATEAAAAADARLDRFLSAASGRVEMACSVGNKYKPADLAALTGNAKSQLEWLVATLAYRRLSLRRNASIREEEVGAVEDAEEMLEALKAGAAVWPFAEAEQASVAGTAPTHTDETLWGDGPRAFFDRFKRNGFAAPYPGRGSYRRY